MRKAIFHLIRLVLLALITLPVCAIVAQELEGDGRLAIPALLPPLLISFLVARLPGRVRLFSRKFLLRFCIYIFATATVAGCFAFLSGFPLYKRIYFAAITAVLTPVFERLAADESADAWDIRVLLVGGFIYLVSGIIAGFLGAPELRGLLISGCVGFLCFCAFFLNSASIRTGYSAQRSVKPSAALVRANVIGTLFIIALTAFIACFDRIRTGAERLFYAAMQGIWRFLSWLFSLGSSTELATETPSGESGYMDFGEAGETSKIAEILQYIFIALAALVAFYLLLRLIRILFKKAVRALRAFFQMLKRYAHTIGDSYQDERVSLIDENALKRAASNVKKRVVRIVRRERYDRLEARARVRYIVRAMYRKTKSRDLSSKTLREAIPSLPHGSAAPKDIIRLYESVRYAEQEPEWDEVERLKREVKV